MHLFADGAVVLDREGCAAFVRPILDAVAHARDLGVTPSENVLRQARAIQLLADIAAGEAMSAAMSASGQSEPRLRTSPENALMTAEAAAGMLDMTARNVRRLAASGALDASKAGRCWLFRRDDLERYREAS